MDYGNLNLELFNHDSIRITTTKAPTTYVYVDPFKLPEGEARPKADVLLITHPHYDHCSVEDIRKITKKETVIITVPDAQSKLVSMDVAAVKLVRPGDEVALEGISVKAVPAYNTDKDFHPKENEWVGYLIELAGSTVYVAGDTDKIPEMRSLEGVDVAFLPVSGTYVMTAEEAAEAAKAIKPKLAIPMHYGDIVGTQQDAQRFKKLLEGSVRVEIIR